MKRRTFREWFSLRFRLEHHPEQPDSCWWMTIVFGRDMDGGSYPTECGTNHWGVCHRCGWSVESL